MNLKQDTAVNDGLVKSRLEAWKKNLIDFSKRNQLLYFKPRPSMSAEIIEDPKEIFRKLVIESKALSFKEKIEMNTIAEFDAFDEPPPGMDINSAGDDLGGFEDTSLEPVFVEGAEGGFDAENFLQTDKDERGLKNCLNKLRTRAKDSLAEQGVNILFMGLYFLEWTDDNKESAKSPLLLIPVSVDRRGLNGAFKINLIEDEIRINPTLTYKLQRDYKIDLSHLEDQLDEMETLEQLAEFIAAIQAIIDAHKEKCENWSICTEATVSLFSFAKLSLYQDLEDNEGRIVNHPLVRKISGEFLAPDEEDVLSARNYLVPADQIDTKIDANKSCQILDADSSQQEAIYAAKAGQSFVLQGPPGTGKSQTISNIVAEALSQNKKILFVSEKKAALDVVVNRLKISKLDKFCLELHGSGQKKSEIIANLRSSLEDIKNMAIENNRPIFLESINDLKASIGKGIEELHVLRDPINKSLFEIYSELAHIELDLNMDAELNFTIPAIEKITDKELSEFDYFFNQLSKKAHVINGFDNFIWRNAELGQLSFELENEIRSNFIEFNSLLKKLKSYANPIAEKYFGRSVASLREFKWLAEACKLALDSPFPKQDWFEKGNLLEAKQVAVKAKNEYEEVSKTRDQLMKKYSEGFLELDHTNLVDRFTNQYKGIFRFLSIDYWKDVHQIKKNSLMNEFHGLKSVISDLEHAAALDKKSYELKTEETELNFVLGDFYKKFDTNWEETLTAIRWVQKITSKLELEAGASSMPLFNVVSDAANQDDFEEFKKRAEDLLKAYEAVQFYLKFYNQIFPVPNLDIDNIDVEEVAEHLQDLLDNLIKIEDWIDFKQLQQRSEELGMGQFIMSLVQSDYQVTDSNALKLLFLRKFYQTWVDKIELENPSLRKFCGADQQLLIDKFKQLDLKQMKKVNIELSKQLALNWIEYASNPMNQESIQTLNQELNKKKRHKPIRILMREIPELLQTLKPCWMMSPLSVSQLIDSRSEKLGDLGFDLIIFDEASQIKTEDAICSIYRGKQLILAGDTHQLPPTNFFNYVSDDDDNYDNHQYESVLDECSVFLNSRSLTWHYRSQHESLIAFSNENIYDGQLISFPSPVKYADDLGIHFELVADGRYEKGARSNRREAKRVAQGIFDHFKNTKAESLGVIAFSEAQQMAIERELASLIRKEPEMSHYFSDSTEDRAKLNLDPFFIKNLENVQGDERDVIFFSIGYARDSKGNLSHNFGPLNRDGGHRRLNVAVTRARRKLKVYSSITGGDIDPSRTSSQGALLLKKYLTFAQTEEEMYRQSYGLDDNIAASDADAQQDVVMDSGDDFALDYESDATLEIGTDLSDSKEAQIQGLQSEEEESCLAGNDLMIQGTLETENLNDQTLPSLQAKKHLSSVSADSERNAEVESPRTVSTSIDLTDIQVFDSEIENLRSLESAIATVLEKRGLIVQRALGASGYKIDLAIADKHDPNNFILALETDGLMYKSAKTARDRERLRTQVLKALGWKVHRVWARDWIKNQQQMLEEILELI